MSGRSSSFVARCIPRTRGGDVDTVPTIETPTRVVRLEQATRVEVGVDPHSGVQVALHGEVLGLGPNPARAMAKRLARGEAAAAAIHGAFAAIVADPRADRLAVLTDRLGSRRVFAKVAGDEVIVSSMLRGHWQGSSRIDPTAVACFLANGAVHGARTLLDGVRVLERACWNVVQQGAIEPIPYWRFEPTVARREIDDDHVRGHLGELITEAVRRHIEGASEVHVSLSGGYDATALLGALAYDLQTPDVRCFSYALDHRRRDADEHRAAQMAAVVGYPHMVVPSYGGDLDRVLSDNAVLGEGLRGLVLETDAWRAVAPLLDPDAVVLAGDECFGGAREHTLRNDHDVLRSVGIHGFGSLDLLTPHLDPEVRAVMSSGMAADIERILGRCPPSADLAGRKDFLYLDQRLANVVLPWRESFALPFVRLRNPLLDNELLDLVAQIPASLRRGKLLFRQTVTARYPALFAVPRAKRTNYLFDLGAEIARHPRVRELATAGESSLDAIVPPSATLALLDRAILEAGVPPSMQARARDGVRAVFPARASNRVRRFRPPPPLPGVSAATLVGRILVLRRALAAP